MFTSTLPPHAQIQGTNEVADAAEGWILARLCTVCGRPLTDPRSVALGAGPRCARLASEAN